MSASNTQDVPHIVIATDDGSLAEHYAGTLADRFRVSTTGTATDAVSFIQQHLPQLVMLDPLLFKGQIKSAISGISTSSPLTRIIITEAAADGTLDQMSLFKAGAHGFITLDISPSLLIKAIQSVSRGEVWVPRKLISVLVSELARNKAAREGRQDPVARKTMAKLTPREFEVAQMVHLGGNNKMIARELDISERTVKAHLSAIFRKLNIASRLHLAIFFNEIA